MKWTDTVTFRVLRDFWRDVHDLDRTGRLSLLKSLARVNDPSGTDLSTMRKRYEEIKNFGHLDMEYRQCLVCGEEADTRHHIVQLQNGGSNRKRNICFLCVDCHAEIHPWLAVHKKPSNGTDSAKATSAGNVGHSPRDPMSLDA